MPLPDSLVDPSDEDGLALTFAAGAFKIQEIREEEGGAGTWMYDCLDHLY